MIRNILLAASIGIALALVIAAITMHQPLPPFVAPPFSPAFKNFIAAPGMVEAESENIAIGVPYSEIVEEIYVRSGMTVAANEPLFKLNTLHLNKKLLAARANYLLTMKKYQKALAEPRPEIVAIQEAIVQEQKAGYEDYLKRFEIVEAIKNPAAISRDEYYQRMYQSIKARFVFSKAQAELELLQAGSWIKDLEILQAEVNLAQKEMEVIEQTISNGTIRAPFGGTVLQVNIHKGELAAIQTPIPHVLFGNLNPLHMRVEINESDIWRVIPGAPGIAVMRGNNNLKVDLSFVRICPYVAIKHSFTGDNTEINDVRVLAIIYRFDPKDLPIYTGMLLDVFLEAKPF